MKNELRRRLKELQRRVGIDPHKKNLIVHHVRGDSPEAADKEIEKIKLKLGPEDRNAHLYVGEIFFPKPGYDIKQQTRGTVDPEDEVKEEIARLLARKAELLEKRKAGRVGHKKRGTGGTK